MTGSRRPAVVITGIVPTGPSGVGDYAELLGGELRRRGFDVVVRCPSTDVRSLRAIARAHGQLLRTIRRAGPGTTVILNHATMATGLRGLPGPAATAALWGRRGVPMVVVAHELAEPTRGQPWRTRVRGTLQRAALLPVVAGADHLVVTTEQRAVTVGRLASRLGRPVTTMPVFSNFGARECDPRGTGGDQEPTFVVAILDHRAVHADPDDVLPAIAAADPGGTWHVELLGSPGPRSPRRERWADAAHRHGVTVHTTGVLATEQYRDHLCAADVVVFPSRQGPSSRKGTLAAALAHGRAIVAFDGPDRWTALVDSGSIVVVRTTDELADALRGLRHDRARRRALGATARRFYDANAALESAGAAFALILEQRDRPSGGPGRRWRPRRASTAPGRGRAGPGATGRRRARPRPGGTDPG